MTKIIVLLAILLLSDIFVINVSAKRYYASRAEYRLSPSQNGLNTYRWRYLLDGLANRYGRYQRAVLDEGEDGIDAIKLIR